MGAYTITEHDPARFTDDEIAEGVAYNNEITPEILPDQPPTPVDVAIAGNRAVPARMRRVSFRARDESGRIVGSVGAGFDPEHDDNPDLMGCSPFVRPEHRRNGLGTRLLAEMVGLAKAEGRTRLIANTFGTVPAGREFALAIGAEAKSAMHLNHLPTAEVDRALMEKWVEEGPGRAPDYELLMWDGPIPEEHLEPFIDLYLVMNDAPRDNLEVNDFTLTPKEWREGEERAAAVGVEQWTLVARRKSDGVLAGFHDVSWAPHEPKFVHVGATGVRPEHRGHALGKWLKATMTLRIIDERPDVEDIRTGNADSNDAMLGINYQMGYRPLLGTETWEVSVEAVEKYLESKGVPVPQRGPLER